MFSMNLGILSLFGIGVFGGLLGAWIFQKLRVPQVVGYIVIGILIGQSGLQLIKHADIIKLQSFNWFALGIIGFLVGGELEAENFRKYGKQFMAILLGEGLAAFFLVSTAVTLIVYFITHSWAPAVAAGIVFGAISSATDPASTVEVLWEYRSRGALTTALIAIVALDDALAMILYGIGTSFAGALTGGSSSLGLEVLKICKDIFGSIFLGLAAAFLFHWILKFLTQQKERMVTLAIGTLLLVIGLANALDLDVIIVTMTMGITLINFSPQRSRELFTLIKSVSMPIYIMFFVLVGARLGVSYMPLWLWGIVIAYILGRSIGKMTGAYFGAKFSKATIAVQKYTGMGLFCQGGVAIGLSIMATQHLGNIQITGQMSLGDMIIFGITATTLIVQLLGPPMVKRAIQLSGEIGRNVTRDDVIASLKVKDVMEKDAIPVEEKQKIGSVFELFSNFRFLVYPVVDKSGRVTGTISLNNLRDILIDQSCWDWVLAEDASTPLPQAISSEMPLKSALKAMTEMSLREVPVIDHPATARLAGILNEHNIEKSVDQELIRRQSGISKQTVPGT
ncbi:MAG: cation:proton antiporter [Candidatus Omnitrophica bacterium]|jgi:Kef-type K+ transport system membrane component KefB/CBS domain-containing protein|nr:cation:proton antiporter [Candidatus Omnitrophota bacterium]MDD3274777.1 cation:proton antiporter [Candidatus Omnitrophota bacterium]MDD5078371.1 cation:proton antiporter [Candidatus Omnitrophota bacterium]MDD5725199.1 cation:proton antiporter [Candidatus Omnitrophota bacterium]